MSDLDRRERARAALTAPADAEAAARRWVDRLRTGLHDGDTKLEIAAYCGDEGARLASNMWTSARRYADSGWVDDFRRWLSRFSVLDRHQVMHGVMAVVEETLPTWEHRNDLQRGFTLEARPRDGGPARTVPANILTADARERYGLDTRHRLAVVAAARWLQQPTDDHWSMWESATMPQFHLEDFVPRPTDDPPTVVVPACARITSERETYQRFREAMVRWAWSDA